MEVEEQRKAGKGWEHLSCEVDARGGAELQISKLEGENSAPSFLAALWGSRDVAFR